MGRISERRALYYEDDPDYDPFVGIDVNEYLIAEYPRMTLNSVVLCGIYVKQMETLTLTQCMKKLMPGLNMY